MDRDIARLITLIFMFTLIAIGYVGAYLDKAGCTP